MLRIERLDRRSMLSVSTDADGWTVVAPAGDTRVVYVSTSTGNDANSGLGANAAVKSFSRAKSLLRNHSADWMLLKRGDRFGSLGSWTLRGRSAQEPLYIGAYGSGERPLIDSGTSSGFNGASNSQGLSNIVIQSLAFVPGSYNHFNGDSGLSGIRLATKGSNILIEDVKITGYKDNIVISGESSTYAVSNVTVRRSQILDSHADPSIGHSQGIYIGAAAGNVTIEQNVIDHNGWRHNTPSDRVDRNHDIYSQTGAQNVIVRDNIISRASFYGVKFNSGGVIQDNFFARNSESVYLEGPATVQDNVVTESVDMPGFAGWGVGINTQKSPSATIRGNIITHTLSASGSGVSGIQLFNNGTPFTGLVEDNIVNDWRNGILILTRGDGPGSVVIRDNELQMNSSSTAALDQRSAAAQSTFAYESNVYASGTSTRPAKINGVGQSLAQWRSRTGEADAQFADSGFPDAGRTIGDYAAGLGAAGSFDGFIDRARSLAHGDWHEQFTSASVNQWFRAGFGRAATVAAERAAFERDRSQPMVEITFSDDVAGTVGSGDLAVQNVSTSQSVAVSWASYDPASRVARFALPETLANGSYIATLAADAVHNASGAILDAGVQVPFQFLVGDADESGRVDVSDFAVMAQHFNQPGTFSQGDFNYSGVVEIGDLAMLSRNFNAQLAA